MSRCVRANAAQLIWAPVACLLASGCASSARDATAASMLPHGSQSSANRLGDWRKSDASVAQLVSAAMASPQAHRERGELIGYVFAIGERGSTAQDARQLLLALKDRMTRVSVLQACERLMSRFEAPADRDAVFEVLEEAVQWADDDLALVSRTVLTAAQLGYPGGKQTAPDQEKWFVRAFEWDHFLFRVEGLHRRAPRSSFSNENMPSK